MADSETDDARTQEKVFAFLCDPAQHTNVQRIETHASSVFLEGDRAIKIKRAVRFPFPDDSTLDKRRAACEEEIQIIRPLSPQFYRRGLPVTLSAEGTRTRAGHG